MSPMMAKASACSPPAPMPWTARNAIGSLMFRERPDSAEPTRKIAIAAWKTGLRPHRSLTFPYSGVDTVEVSM